MNPSFLLNFEEFWICYNINKNIFLRTLMYVKKMNTMVKKSILISLICKRISYQNDKKYVKIFPLNF